MSAELITIILFGALFLGLVLGLPVTFVMGGVAVLATLLLWGPSGLYVTIVQIFGWMRQPLLIAVPLFIMMGLILERSGIADDLFEAITRWFGFLRGGLAITSVIICVIFAAMTGVTAAATITMGLIALPAMLKRGYDKKMALGAVMGPGTLGILIPPSVLMIILGLTTNQSAAKLFMAGFIPGIVLASLFILYILIRSYTNKKLCPVSERKYSWREKIASLKSLILPFIIVLSVLGSIFGGVATPTEAASLGTIACFLAAAVNRRLNLNLLRYSCLETFRMSTMVVFIIFGAVSFTAVYIGVGGHEVVEQVVTGLELNRWVIVSLMLFILLIMGCFLDPGGIVLIAAPVFSPIVKVLGFDLIWFNILFVIFMQIGYLTPPFGVNLFYMKGICPPSISLTDIYRAAVPYVLLMIFGTSLMMIFPQIILWLPSVVG